jgi:hypothetical protein
MINKCMVCGDLYGKIEPEKNQKWVISHGVCKSVHCRAIFELWFFSNDPRELKDFAKSCF